MCPGVITEKGRVACGSVVQAGGVWASLFCKSLGFAPAAAQGAGLGAAHRTDRTKAQAPAAWGPGLSLRKRLDGGYTVSHGSVIADIVPDSFRYFSEFLPLSEDGMGRHLAARRTQLLR